MKLGEKIALGLAAAGAVLLAGYEIFKKKPAASQPVSIQWTSLGPNQDGSFTIPNDVQFAISSAAANPQVQALNVVLQSAVSAGMITPATPSAFPYPLGTPAPSWWPAGDAAGNTALRWAGTVGARSIVLPAANNAATSVWIA